MADSRTLRVVIVGNASSAEEAIEGLAETSQDAGNEFDAMGGKMGRFRGAMAGMGAAVLAALPVAALYAFAKGLEEIENRAKLAASMGLTGKDAAQAGKLAGDLYVAGFGESTAETGQIVKRVSQDLNMSVNDVDFKPLAKKIGTISQVMDKDIGETTRGVSNLLRNGLAKNADEAMDIVAAGFTNGVDKSEDFLDTLNEYGTQFRKLGIDGVTATGILSQGLKAGARDADIVADAIKEFSIRALDGSETTAKGFEAIGLDAADMAKKIGAGGTTASEALQLTMDMLRAIEDPVMRSQAAVGLFGTQSEDLGDALYALDPKSAVTALGKVGGAADQMADTMHHNAAAKLETFKRRLEMGFTNAGVKAISALESIGHKVGPVFDRIGQASAPFTQKLGEIGGKVRTSFDTGAARTALDQLGQKLSGIWAIVGPALSQFVTFFKTQLMPVFQELWVKAQPILVQLWQTFMIYLDAIKVGIQNFIIVAKFLWQTFGETILTFVKSAWDAIWQVIGGALSIIQGLYNVFIGLFTGNWSRAWEGVKQIFSGVWEIICGIFNAAIAIIWGALSLALDTMKAYWGAIWNAIASHFRVTWNDVTGFFRGVMSSLGPMASSAIEQVKNFFVNGFNSLYSSAKSKLGDVVDVFRDIPAQARKALSGLPEQMYSIGRNIVDGIVNGIRNSLGSVMSAARAIVDKIPGPIRDALGIHSPSRVMAEIGKFISQGLVNGMLGGAAKVGAASKKLSGMVSDAFGGGDILQGEGDIAFAVGELAGVHPTGQLANRSINRAMEDRAAAAQSAPNVYVTVQGNVTAEKALAKAIASTVRDEIVRNGKRNGGRTGL
ncbi:phage tail tape measure protein [Streptomyces sp. NPDC059949]|uniref:phage tail tape measure protein n=1 Tax=Streptomyces sp. NPDC059949 TaxID=3347013 RepID=UPI0036630AB3